jgi:hypothetical protein
LTLRLLTLSLIDLDLAARDRRLLGKILRVAGL